MQPMSIPGRPALPGTDAPGAPTPMPGAPTPPMPGLPDTPFQPPRVPGTGETVPRPMAPDTNIPDTGETVPRPDMPDPGAAPTPNDDGGFVPTRAPNDDFPVVTPVPAPA